MLAMSEVGEFYRDKTVLITGATGFMGKVLVEKLLRSCPSVGRVFLLLRPKGSKTVQDRLQELLQNEVFSVVRDRDSSLFDKVEAVSGDIMEPVLGLHTDDCDKLKQQVNIIFHAAATVKFDEELTVSVDMNVKGTQQLLRIAHEMMHLQAFVHVSTAYCNCDRPVVEEKIYDMSLDPNCLVEKLAQLDPSTVSRLTPILLENRPNTYTFTKALAESLIVAEKGDLPMVIIRPSIVSCAWREPIPGWVDNLNGCTGLIAGVGRGYINSIMCNGQLNADLVPVEVPINLMVTAAWHIATHRPRDIPVFNCTSSVTLSWNQMHTSCFPKMLSKPSLQLLTYPNCTFTSHRAHHWLLLAFTRLLPSFLADFYRLTTGKQPRMQRAFWKMTKAIGCLEYFCTNEWVFVNKNMSNLRQLMTQHDREEFNFSMQGMDWGQYFDVYWHGIKKFVFREQQNDRLARATLYRKHCLGVLFRLATVTTVLTVLQSRYHTVTALLATVRRMISSLIYTIKLILSTTRMIK